MQRQVSTPPRQGTARSRRKKALLPRENSGSLTDGVNHVSERQKMGGYIYIYTHIYIYTIVGSNNEFIELGEKTTIC